MEKHETTRRGWARRVGFGVLKFCLTFALGFFVIVRVLLFLMKRGAPGGVGKAGEADGDVRYIF